MYIIRTSIVVDDETLGEIDDIRLIADGTLDYWLERGWEPWPLATDEELAGAAAGLARRSALWVPTAAYKAGEIVVHEDQLFTADADFISGGSWDRDDWTMLGAGELGYDELLSPVTVTAAEGWKDTGLACEVKVSQRPMSHKLSGIVQCTVAGAIALRVVDQLTDETVAVLSDTVAVADSNHKLDSFFRVTGPAGVRTYTVDALTAAGSMTLFTGEDFAWHFSIEQK